MHESIAALPGYIGVVLEKEKKGLRFSAIIKGAS
jgi:hypothetical protein